MKIRQFLIFCFWVSQLPILYSQQDSTLVLSETDVGGLIQLAEEWSNEFTIKNAEAIDDATINGIPTIFATDSTLAQLMFFDEDNEPVYYTTYNTGAARTTNTNVINTGVYNLNGAGMHIGEWDAGAILRTHEQLSGRVTQVDGARTLHDHAVHVAGTLIGDGTGSSTLASSAKGMAPRARLHAHYWDNDVAEMARYARNGGLISNHSYGRRSGWTYSGNIWSWSGGRSNLRSNGEDPGFGAYTNLAREYDELANKAPYYLICKAAGNDASDRPRNGDPFIADGLRFTYNSSSHPGADGNYDCIGYRGNAKNILTVGAVHDVTTYTGPSSVRIAEFSSRGPTDDGRIKPDIVGNGVNVSSSNATGNSRYSRLSGTSMATPNVAGSLLLLQEHYQKQKGSGKFMRSATLKALAIHTAREAGSGEGPDYTFGWGLLDAKAAADQITRDRAEPNSISEKTLLNGRTYRITVNVNTNKPLIATIVWNDPLAAASSGRRVDDRTKKLVNDLDLRVSNGGNTYLPYRLNPFSPSARATKGDNSIDNVEKVYIGNVSGSSATITVTHKGRLVGGRQPFSLIISELRTSTATCSDGIQNGNETGVDCGGSCAACSCFTAPFTLKLTFDNYPRETSWIIKNASGGTVHRSPSYSSRPRSSTIYARNLTIPAGNRYTFSMLDSDGDGLCCAHGRGNYRLTDSKGKLVASGSNFGRSRSTTFCVGSTPCPNPTNINITNITSNRANVSWRGVTGGSSYAVSYKPSGGTWLGKRVTSTSTAISGLRSNTTYSVAIRATCGNEKSSRWVYKSFRTTGSTCPDLTVSRLKVNSHSRNRFDYSYTFLNRGNATASRTNVNFRAYLSKNKILDRSDVPIGGAKALTSNISAGRILSGRNVQSGLNINAITHPYLIVKIDASNRLTECRENNNIRVYRIPSSTLVCSKPSNLRTRRYKKTLGGRTLVNTATFSWNHVYGAKYYDVAYKKMGTSRWTWKRGIRTNNLRINVAAKTNYVWYVRARCINNKYSSWNSQGFRSLAEDEVLTDDCKDLTISDLKVTARTDNRIDYRYTIANEGRDTLRTTVVLKGVLSDDELYNNTGDIEAGSTTLNIDLPPDESLSGTLGMDVAINTATHQFLLLKVDSENSLLEECDEQNNEHGVSIGGTCISPDNLIVTDIDAESATLNWSAVAGAMEYDLAYTSADVENWQTVTVTGTSYNITELSDSTSYYWMVRTVCGTDDFSEEMYSSFETVQGLGINAETILGAGCDGPRDLSESEITDIGVLLSWNATLDVSSYEIRYRPLGAEDEVERDPGEWIIESDILDTSYPLTDLSPETGYEWEVRTECIDGLPSEWSASSFITFEDDCLSVNFTELNDTSMLSSVYIAGDISSAGRVQTGRKVIMEATNSITLKAGFEAQAGSDFHAYLSNCSLSTFIPDTSLLDKRVVPVFITDELAKPQLEVFPNPLEHNATIRFYLPTTGMANVFVFDLNGQLLTEQTTENSLGWNTTQLDATRLPAGMYYVSLQTLDGVLTKKIMIVK